MRTGALPLGLTLDPATGAITGTPTTAGDATFTVTATNSVGADSTAFSMSVTAAAITPITVLTPSNGSTVDPSFTITGTGEFGSHVTMTNDSGVGSSAFDISNADGSWSIGINPVFEPGTHTLTFTQDADGSVGTLTFTIAAAPVTPEPTTPASPSPADGKLSSTGADAAPLLLIGGLLAAAGVTAAVIGRKRRQRA